MDTQEEQGRDHTLSNRFLASFTHLIVRMQEVDDSCVEITKNITKQDLWLITFIFEKKSVIMREVAEFLSVPLSTATWTVDKLVKKRYLKRFNSPEDRRVVKVELTKKGNETADFFGCKKQEMADLILNGLSQEQGNQFVDILELVSQNMRKHADLLKPEE